MSRQQPQRCDSTVAVFLLRGGCLQSWRIAEFAAEFPAAQVELRDRDTSAYALSKSRRFRAQNIDSAGGGRAMALPLSDRSVRPDLVPVGLSPLRETDFLRVRTLLRGTRPRRKRRGLSADNVGPRRAAALRQRFRRPFAAGRRFGRVERSRWPSELSSRVFSQGFVRLRSPVRARRQAGRKRSCSRKARWSAGGASISGSAAGCTPDSDPWRIGRAVRPADQSRVGSQDRSERIGLFADFRETNHPRSASARLANRGCRNGEGWRALGQALDRRPAREPTERTLMTISAGERAMSLRIAAKKCQHRLATWKRTSLHRNCKSLGAQRRKSPADIHASTGPARAVRNF